MSSNAGQNLPPSKAVNIPNTVSSTPFHSTAPVDNSSQKRVGGPGSSRPGMSSKSSATPRNNQARKNQHNRQRKPRLLDDDEYNESVGSQVYLLQSCLLTLDFYLGRHEIHHQPEGTDVHHSLDELFTSTSPTIPSTSSQHPTVYIMGSGRNRQIALCSCELSLYCDAKSKFPCSGSQCRCSSRLGLGPSSAGICSNPGC